MILHVAVPTCKSPPVPYQPSTLFVSFIFFPRLFYWYIAIVREHTRGAMLVFDCGGSLGPSLHVSHAFLLLRFLGCLSSLLCGLLAQDPAGPCWTAWGLLSGSLLLHGPARAPWPPPTSSCASQTGLLQVRQPLFPRACAGLDETGAGVIGCSSAG